MVQAIYRVSLRFLSSSNPDANANLLLDGETRQIII
jgi:hypothetical protein